VAYKHRNPKSNIISTNNRNKKAGKEKDLASTWELEQDIKAIN
jgi:hypothetical protein